MRRHILDFWIPSHDAEGAVLRDRCFPRRKEILTKKPVGQGDCAAFQAAEWLALRGEISHERDGSVRRTNVRALRSAHDRFGNARSKIWIFSVALFVTPHARLSVEPENHSRKNVDTHCTRLTSRRRVDRLHKRHIKATAQGKSFRKNGCSREHAAMRAFFVFKERDLEPCLSQ